MLTESTHDVPGNMFCKSNFTVILTLINVSVKNIIKPKNYKYEVLSVIVNCNFRVGESSTKDAVP